MFDTYKQLRDSTGTIKPGEYGAAIPLLNEQTKRYLADGKLYPVVVLLHVKPGEENESFVLLFCVPYRTAEDLTGIAYNIIRLTRLSQNEFIDWFAVAGELIDTKLSTVC